MSAISLANNYVNSRANNNSELLVKTRFLNARSAVRSCPWSPYRIKPTTSLNCSDNSAYYHGISFIFTRIHDSYLGKTRGKIINLITAQEGGSMAKRFTDTSKWKKPWFRGLSTNAKLVWIYLCDECDHAGIWPADFELISFQVGFKVTAQNLELWLGDKVWRVADDKYFIPGFLEFQYGSKDNKFRAKASAIEALEALGVLNPDGSIKVLPNSPLSLSEELPNSIGIGIGKSISNKGGAGGKLTFVKDLEEIYREYPRKEGKAPGLKKLISDIKTVEDLESFRLAVQKYRKWCEERKKEPEFIKMFSTFANNWREVLDADWGTTQSFSESSDDKYQRLFAGQTND
jgi:hypothetical protein